MVRVRGLYPILDLERAERHGWPPGAFLEQLLQAKPQVVQLRAKRASARRTLEVMSELVPACRRQGVLFFANDRPDLARLAGADGVHLGQDDLPIFQARALFPELRIGVSTHDLPQLERALSERPDYVAFGPIFETRTKAGADPTVGLEKLEKAARMARALAVPLVAIGGIDRATASSVGRLGVMAAIIGGLEAQTLDQVGARARELQAMAQG